MKKLLFFDVETTGTEKGDEICQIAMSFSEDGESVTRLSEVFATSKPLTPVSMAIHHITPPMQEGKQLFVESDLRERFISLLGDGYIPVAHNAKFDVGMMKEASVPIDKFICTLKLAKYLDEDGKLEAHNLQYLRYHFGMYEIEATAHDALGDVVVLEKVFEKLVPDSFSVEDLIRISTRPSLIKVMPFGKHKGLPLSEVPADYVGWLRGQWAKDGNEDEDLAYSFKQLGI